MLEYEGDGELNERDGEGLDVFGAEDLGVEKDRELELPLKEDLGAENERLPPEEKPPLLPAASAGPTTETTRNTAATTTASTRLMPAQGRMVPLP